MRTQKLRAFSWAGSTLAILHVFVFGAAYIRYLMVAGAWFADLPLVIVSTPFILPMRWLDGGSYDYAGDMSQRVLAAAVWGTALAYFVGWALESLVRLLVSATKR
jgi:hypothetical protein